MVPEWLLKNLLDVFVESRRCFAVALVCSLMLPATFKSFMCIDHNSKINVYHTYQISQCHPRISERWCTQEHTRPCDTPIEIFGTSHRSHKRVLPERQVFIGHRIMHSYRMCIKVLLLTPPRVARYMCVRRVERRTERVMQDDAGRCTRLLSMREDGFLQKERSGGRACASMLWLNRERLCRQ